MELAEVGDMIECDVQNPSPRTIRAVLSTPEACAMGNDLLMDKTSGWRKTPKCKHCGKFYPSGGSCSDCNDTPH